MSVGRFVSSRNWNAKVLNKWMSRNSSHERGQELRRGGE